MTKLTKTLAKEWLTLIGGILIGFLLVPALVYAFFSPASYTSSHSLGDAYKELTGMLFGKGGRSEVWVAIAIVLGPYLLYQFGRSIMWAIRTMKEH